MVSFHPVSTVSTKAVDGGKYYISLTLNPPLKFDIENIIHVRRNHQFWNASNFNSNNLKICSEEEINSKCHLLKESYTENTILKPITAACKSSKYSQRPYRVHVFLIRT